MSDDIANAAAPVADGASTAAPEPAAPSIRDTMSAVFAKHNPARDDAGRFGSNKTEPEAEAAPVEAAPAATETPDQPEAPKLETATPSIEPPASWSADVKAKWATLPPDLQAYIAKREGEAHQAITSTGEKAKAYEALDAVLGPRRQSLRATWGDEGAAIKQLFELSDFATNDPAGFARWFVQQHRIDPALFTSAPAQAGQPADPQVAALHGELQSIKTTIAQQQMAEMDNAIKAFADAKDVSGNARHPHFQDVRAEMGRLMAAGIAATLDDAYAKAIRTNDTVWAKVQAEEAAQRAKAEEARVAKEREAAAKAAKEAQRAASVNVRSVGAVSGSPTRPASMRETMEAVFRKSQSAA
jgi:hypothetical protein